jgi:preprotein translocase subunit SecG
VTIFLTVLHVMVSVVLIVVVLLQHGKGADIGAVFGGGASSTVFGSRGAGNFLTKLTTGSAFVFMVTSLSLAYLSNTSGTRGIFEDQPAAPASAPAPSATAPAPEAPQGGFEEVKPAEPAKPEAAAPAKPEASAAPAPAPAAEKPAAAPEKAPEGEKKP